MIRRKTIAGVILGSAMLAGTAWAQGLQAVRVEAAGTALNDPEAAFWAKSPEVAVPMLPQNITTPKHQKAAVSELKVRAAHNGAEYAFRIEWSDPTQSDRIVVDAFGDQVAVELPLVLRADAPPPSPMMGNPDGRVSILQWRAAFQRDLIKGEPTVRDLYPFAHVDVYPDEVLRATDARPYTGALGLDNPISHGIETPVLDQMAEGWGTLTVKPEQHGDGRGVWKDGRWSVVISHPFSTGTDNDPAVAPGGETMAAFAVWEGGAREVGARKAWANWVPLKIE
jgi:hypothetical protein